MQTRTREIAAELYHAVALLGAKSDLLSIIGSWGDSLNDDQIVAYLREWNAKTAEELKACIDSFETASLRRERSEGAGPQTNREVA